MAKTRKTKSKFSEDNHPAQFEQWTRRAVDAALLDHLSETALMLLYIALGENTWRDRSDTAVERGIRRRMNQFAKRIPDEPSPAVEIPPPDEELVIEIARELYDRFVMGGWEPQDAYPQIRRWLAQVPQGGERTQK